MRLDSRFLIDALDRIDTVDSIFIAEEKTFTVVHL